MHLNDYVRPLKLTSFLILLGGAAFLAITVIEHGAWPWQSWRGSNSVHAANGLLRQIGSIDVPGPKGKRFDYLTIDPARHLLFSTHLGAGLLHVVDLRTNKVINTVEDLPGIEGIELASDVNKAYTSNWLENKIGVIDLAQMKLIK